MLVNFKALDITIWVCPFDGRIQADIETDINQTAKLEITEYITIMGYD